MKHGRLSALIIAWICGMCLFSVGAQAATSKPAIVLNKTYVTLGATAGLNNQTTLIPRIKYNSLGLDTHNIRWTSGNESVARVENGVLTGVGYGVTRVVARLDGARSDFVYVRVKKICAKSLKVIPAKKVLYVGLDGQGATTVTMQGSISPAKADQQTIRWVSGNPSVATVDPATGLVTPVKPGKCKIVGCVDGTKVRKAAIIVVKGIVPTSVGFAEDTAHVAPGGKITLTPLIEPAYAWNQKVTYQSLNKRIATVSASGVVTGVALGETVVRVTTVSGLKVGTIKVIVDLSGSRISYLAIAQEAYRTYTQLDGPYVDAKAFEDTLRKSEFGQVGAITGDLCRNLTAAQMLAALENAATGKTENDITYIFYSGHGMDGASRADRGALVGVDGQMVRVDQVKAKLDAIPGMVVVVLDCCLSGQYLLSKGASAPATAADARAFSNAFIDAFESSPVSTARITAKGSTTLIATATKNKYRIVVASRPRESSWMYKEGPSFMTQYVTEAGGAIWSNNSNAYSIGENMPADGNGDDWLSLNELYQYAYARVLALARSEGVSQHMAVWPTSSAYPIFARQ